MAALSPQELAALRRAPDHSWAGEGDAEAILALHERGYVELMKLGYWNRYLYQRTAAGRKAAAKHKD